MRSLTTYGSMGDIAPVGALPEVCWESWSTWALKEGEPPESRKSFYQRLEQNGCHPQRKNPAGRGFRGLKVK